MDIEFKNMVEQKFKQSDTFQKEMLNFKKEMLEFKDTTNQTLAILTQAVSNLTKSVDVLSKTVNEIHEHLILMETQLNDKVAILFDGHITNVEQHEGFNQRLENLDNITTRQSFRISSLEDKVNLNSK